MKHFYLLPLLLFSCNNQKEKDKQLIEFNEKLNENNELIDRQKRRIEFLEDELANCKMNYKVLESVAK